MGVFHVQVLHTSPLATDRSVQHIEFLWICWFGIDPEHRYGHKAARLPKIGFVPESDPLAFGFLDPSLVLRGCHLIPAFNDGRTSDLLTAPLTAARPPDEVDDWVSFYVNMYAEFFALSARMVTALLIITQLYSFVDRDMFMRYTGGGIGHSFFNSKYGMRDSGDIDIGNGCEHGEGDEDQVDDDDEPYEEDDLDDDEEDGSDPEDEEEDELGPEDGEDVDWDDNNEEHGFTDF